MFASLSTNLASIALKPSLPHLSKHFSLKFSILNSGTNLVTPSACLNNFIAEVTPLYGFTDSGSISSSSKNELGFLLIFWILVAHDSLLSNIDTTSSFLLLRLNTISDILPRSILCLLLSRKLFNSNSEPNDLPNRVYPHFAIIHNTLLIILVLINLLLC